MSIQLKGGPNGGERWPRISDMCRSFWRMSDAGHHRYRNSGQTDPATGSVIFVYSPLRRRVSA